MKKIRLKQASLRPDFGVTITSSLIHQAASYFTLGGPAAFLFSVSPQFLGKIVCLCKETGAASGTGSSKDFTGFRGSPEKNPTRRDFPKN
jgi:hypothetical protein